MNKLYQILSTLEPQQLAEVQDMMNKNDDEGLKAFLAKYVGGVSSKVKVQSSTRPEVKKPAKTQASLPLGFEFFRYCGNRCKNIPYHDVTICLEPKDIIGIHPAIDYAGEMKIICPGYSKNAISVAGDIVNLIKSHCKPFGGDIAKVLSSADAQQDKIEALFGNDDKIKDFVSDNFVTPLQIKDSEDESALRHLLFNNKIDWKKAIKDLLYFKPELRDNLSEYGIQASLIPVTAGVTAQKQYVKDNFKDKKFDIRFDFDSDEDNCLVFYCGNGGLFTVNNVNDPVIVSKIKRPFRAVADEQLKEEMAKRLKDVNKKFDEKLEQLALDYFAECQKQVDKLQGEIADKKVTFASTKVHSDWESDYSEMLEQPAKSANPNNDPLKVGAMKEALCKCSYKYDGFIWKHEYDSRRNHWFSKSAPKGEFEAEIDEKLPVCYIHYDCDNGKGKMHSIMLSGKIDNFEIDCRNVSIDKIETFISKRVKEIEKAYEAESKKWLAKHKDDIPRDKAIAILKKANPKAHIKPSEDFDKNSKGGIWLVGYEWESLIADMMIDNPRLSKKKLSDFGDPMYDPDGAMEGFMGSQFCTIFGLKGWTSEWYDSATLMLYEDNY